MNIFKESLLKGFGWTIGICAALELPSFTKDLIALLGKML